MKRRTCTSEHAGMTVRTAAGMVDLFFSGRGITRVELPHARKKSRVERLGAGTAGTSRPTVGKNAANQFRRYFSGKPVTFDVPLDLGQATDFQKAVWKAAATIPYGETRSYAWVAKLIGRPTAARAVGQALGANPVPVIIPCHRVISSAGTLGGFSGGLAMKKHLLGMEAGGQACTVAQRKKRRNR